MTRSIPLGDDALDVRPSRNAASRFIHPERAPFVWRKALQTGLDSEVWEAWGEYLSVRTTPQRISTLLSGARRPLRWSMPGRDGRLALEGLLERLDQGLRKRRRPGGQSPGETVESQLRQWLEAMPAGPVDAAGALETLAWCHALPRLALAVPAALWWELVEQLVRTAQEAQRLRLACDPLPHQLLAGELGLTLGYLLPEFRTCTQRIAPARRALSRGLTGLLHGEGLLPAKDFALLHPLLGCWTRCLALGKTMPDGPWSEPAHEQFQRFVGTARSLMRRDGTPVFSAEPAEKWHRELWENALRLGADGARARRSVKGQDARGARRLSAASLHVESAATAVLCSEGSGSQGRLTVLYAGQSVRMEFACGRDVLWSGPWTLEVHCGGVLAVPTGRWEEVCWVSDDEANYLELEMRFSGGLRVQRQMLLARRDRFLMLADVILGRGAGPTTYRGCLPLAEGVDWRGGSETREGVIAGPSRCLRGLPLALPEWQATPAGGQSRRTPQGLELWQSTEAARLLAPWFLDFDQRRSGRPLTWRQLTVAENRASVPRHQAAGFRVMIGAQQWLIYRALGGRGNRTLLGHNLSSEMLVGRFNRRGEVKPLVEVE